MKKIHKIVSIALIFVAIGVFLCQGLAYSLSNFYTLRPASQFNSLSRETTELLQQGAGKTSRGIRYEEYGDPEGIPLVLIPGIDGITEVYSSQLDFFKQSGFHIVAYYLPIAEEAMAQGKEYSFEFIVQDLCEVMDELGIEKSHVIGTSFGSFVAQQFKIKHHEKVDRLVLVSSAAYLELPWLLGKLAKLVPYLPLSLSARLFARDVISDQDGGFREKRDEYRRGIMETTARNTIVERVRLGNQFNSYRPDLQGIQGDVLIIYGEHDGFMGKRDALRLKEALPNANVEVISLPAGHFPQWIVPNAFNREVRRFL